MFILLQWSLPMSRVAHKDIGISTSLLHGQHYNTGGPHGGQHHPPLPPITVSNRLISLTFPSVISSLFRKEWNVLMKTHKRCCSQLKRQRGFKKKIFRKEWSTIVEITNQGSRNISARWPWTGFYFCPCQEHRWMRPRTNTSPLTRDTSVHSILH